jgi:oligopeptidase B
VTELGTLAPPSAPRRPKVLSLHGDERVDDWYWLRARDDPATTAYLEAENAYTEAMTAPTAALRERLYEEIRGRIQETDESAPVPYGGHWYFRRTVEGLQYAIHCRRTGAEDGPAEVLLDENVLAEGHDYFRLGVLAVSPDHARLAYSTDVTGAERYTLRVRDLASGRDLPDEISNTYYGLAWSSDSQTVFYTRPDDAMRPHQVWRHAVGTDPARDVCVYEEADERFFLSVHRTRSGSFIVVSAESMITSEVHVLDAADAEGEFRVVEPRRQGIEYSLDHHGGRFLIVTNDEAPNFRLMETPVDSPGREQWRELIPHRDDVRLLGVDAFAGHLALYERAEALRRIRVVDPETAEGAPLGQPEPVYAAFPGENREFETNVLRFEYTSLVTPPSAVDYDVARGERTLRKQDPVLGYEPERYATERTWARAPDGERVPLSLVYSRDRPEEAGPALLVGYGSYEASTDPVFSSARVSLLDRGFLIAIAHVRGGGELGRRWYEHGKLDHKRNTFTDFVACAEHLVAEGWTSPGRLVARGGSAGGLLMGAAVNLRPELFGAVVAEVPFVDVVTTMLDQSLPLTVIEWEEWGNPHDRRLYDAMKAYSPYDNVEAKDYPPLLVTAGLHDSRVAYWEPAKWVAKLRATKTDSNPLLLRTRMDAGHAGPSGRYERWREEAFVYAFILDALGLASSSHALDS